MCGNYRICLLNMLYKVFCYTVSTTNPLWRQVLEIISVGLGLENLLQTISSVRQLTGKERMWS
jgi:hypothetical protein